MSASVAKSPLIFFLLVFALSIPFFLVASLFGEVRLLPGLPVSSLMVVAPVTAALILVYRENKIAGVTGLLKRSFDHQRIRAKVWYLPVLLLMPGVMILSFGLARLMGSPVPVPQFSILSVLILFLVFFVAGLAEELGWMGYAIDPMQERWGTLTAALLLGLIWAAWHLIPLLQVHRPPEWIAWWCLATVASRVIMVWLYNNAGKSVFAMALYHALSNLGWQLYPINGSFYDPRITGLILTVVAVIVIVLWGPKTLARYKFVRLG